MNEKELTKEDIDNIDKQLSDVEDMLRFSILDDESYLINHFRNYLRMKTQKINH